MPLTHLLLALAVVAIWGTNFVVIRLGLDTFAPYTFAALRYTFSVLPFVFFIRKPAVSWGKLAAFGVLIGVGQFGLLFWAMRSDISPGLASLVIQSQVFFTIAFAAVLYRERLKRLQWPAFALAIAGLAIVATHVSAGAGVTLFGVALVTGGAISWAAGNLVARAAGRVDALGFMVWSSPFAAVPLWAITLAVDGPTSIGAALAHASATAWAAVAWQSIGNTLFGYGAWNWLLARHPASTVTPTALLVPVFGMSASALALHEGLPAWKLGAAALVMGGLALNVLATRRRA
ncbi:MAG: EamA family transporter [Burkholderiales bacterium]|nr:EamA family transporter [Burkholderiales bacterium]